eukprot:CAMPEP_0197715156 /NCGR_PEP_ID=MMETSP1434-20131217/377_1 /TAXON_ID=265543 /ORGANISM="Minutocellus polymorphus, Strain CCMP3303" /LENGTH=489 /DNA_ID=CAMNT_0043299181 /DNA_START=1 /DNA_END=1470 /DNA_ORIENTATION=-
MYAYAHAPILATTSRLRSSMPPFSHVTSNVASLLVVAGAVSSCVAVIFASGRKRGRENSAQTSRRSCSDDKSTYESLIGRTPLIKLTKLSALLGDGRSVYVKMECMNPGGTGKDRAALRMIQDAEECGALPPPLGPCGPCGVARTNDSAEAPTGDESNHMDESIRLAISRSRTGGIVVEGTSGSTGISLASLCAVRGHSAIVVMPDDQAKEKQTMLKCLGAVVHIVPNAAISNPNQYVNVARRIANRINDRSDELEQHEELAAGRCINIKATFINQFENLSNYSTHLEWTGPELWSQAGGNIDAFVMSSGTGGTISGVGRYLKSHSCNPYCKVVLVDPPGSALHSKIKYGVAYASQQSERTLRRHRYDTLAEGIGLDRVTANFAMGCDAAVIDDSIRVSDQEAVDMAHWLLREEGLFVGSSSAMNVVGAVRVAANLPPNSNAVTIICDGGQRHVSRFWNRDFVVDWGLQWPEDGSDKSVPSSIAELFRT